MTGPALTQDVGARDRAPTNEHGEPDSPSPPPVLEIVVPVYNEERDLRRCVERVHDHLSEHVPYTFGIVIADNASTDATSAIADDLAAALPGVSVVHLADKGRGRALRHVWSRSRAQVVAYTDVDLSTDLAALYPLVAPLLSGHSDVAIGTRLRPGARVVRGAQRELLSRGYNLLLKGTLATRFSDAQCGFKAVRRDVAERLLPLVHDEGWFFDTELLVLAERCGLRIHEVPVDWVDDADSRVDILATALADLRGVARLGSDLWRGRLPLAEIRTHLGRPPLVRDDRSGATLAGQAIRFAAVGIASTLAYLLLYVLLRTGMGAQAANFTALAVTAVANTAANRRFTFGIRGRSRAGTHQAQGFLVFLLGLGLTSGALFVMHRAAPDATRWLELGVLVAANAAATIVRFLLLRHWVFSRHRAH